MAFEKQQPTSWDNGSDLDPLYGLEEVKEGQTNELPVPDNDPTNVLIPLDPTTEDQNNQKDQPSGIQEEVLPTEFLSTINDLFEKGVLDPYEGYEIKTKEDLVNLIEDNKRSWEDNLNTQIFEQRLQELNPQFQSIVKYGLNGGQDIQTLLETWKDVENTFSIDDTTDQGKEAIVREYLTLTNYGTPDVINEDIATWKELGKLDSKVDFYKPQLQEYHMSKVAEIEQSAMFEQQQKEQYFNMYTNEVGKVLNQDKIAGLDLDQNLKAYLYENVQPIYRSSLTNEPIDALQAVVEDLKFGENANPEFYTELLLHATNPDAYKQMLLTQLKTEAAISTEKVLRKQVQRDITGGITPQQQNSQRTNDMDRW